MSVPLLVVLSYWLFSSVIAQEPVIDLRGGSLTGVSLYSSHRTVVYGFLGIPYARPPIGPLRFRPPERHPGWNRTLPASRFGPACPQPGAQQVQSSEDCLTLNVWIPQYPVGFRPHPVVIFFEGELFTYGNPARFPAEDLTAEGVVVVSVNYRLNVLGFFCLETPQSPGNLGLLDQYLAMRWVRDNIERFGGDVNRITVMGHSAGAASIGLHMVSPRTQGLFQQAILMSGNALSPWAITRRARSTALGFARDLNCLFEDSDAVLDCLRNRDIEHMMRAVDRSYRFGNNTDLFLPVVDSFLPEGFQYIPVEPHNAISKGDYLRVPILSGLSSHDGVLLFHQTPELTHASAAHLRRFFETAAIPQAMAHSGLDANWYTIQEVLRFVFVEEAADANDINLAAGGTRHTLLEQLIDFYTEAYFVGPHSLFLQLITHSGGTAHAYAFGYRGPDLYGNTLNVTGAPHGSILLYLFGPAVYHFQVGRDFNAREREVSQRTKREWVNFIQNADPSPATYALRWAPYTVQDPFYYIIEEDRVQRGYLPYRSNFWNNFLPRLNRLAAFSASPYDEANGRGIIDPVTGQVIPGPGGPGYPGQQRPYAGSTRAYYREGSVEPFRSLFFVLLALVLVLLLVMALAWACVRSRRRRRHKEAGDGTTAVTGVSRFYSPSTSTAAESRDEQSQQPGRRITGVRVLY